MLKTKRGSLFSQLVLFFCACFYAEISGADPKQAIVGVATNFITTIETLQRDFETRHEGKLIVVGGSTGKLYAQINQGAPIDIFLSADQARPAQLEDDGLAIAGSQFTYAIGRLIAWLPGRSTGPGHFSLSQEETVALLKNSSRIALANADLAPYGLASKQLLQSLGLYEELGPRIVRGENIGQTFSLISSGNAEAGFIALTQALAHPEAVSNDRYWMVDETMHTPIRQDAILLKRAAENPIALAFMQYLRSPAARQIIREAGYAIADYRP